MKKFISVLLAVILMTVMTTVIFARGYGNNGNAAAKYSVCTVENCVLKGLHSHNNKTYCAHYYGDGHEYHNYCDIEECVLTGYHEHDGTYCFAHTPNDGHGHRNMKNYPCGEKCCR